MKSHVEIIECPECSYIQQAEVKRTFPFWSYVHECERCKYMIMESEWESKEPNIKQNGDNYAKLQ